MLSPALSALRSIPRNIPRLTTIMSAFSNPASLDATTTTPYVPPKVWQWDGDTSNMNRPTAGPRNEQTLSRGEHSLQLYSLATPNGQKVTIMLEELLAAGYTDAEYDAWLINIGQQDQFGSDFTKINPNSKIPALLDYSDDQKEPVRVFESASILLYLAEKFDHAFFPNTHRTEILNWLFWQVGSAPYAGQLGHFFGRDDKLEYPIDRFAMETKRQLDVLNRELATKPFIAGDVYTIADMAIFTWYGAIVLHQLYGDALATFLRVDEDYPHVQRWAREIAARPAVVRGRAVNKIFGDHIPKLHERHAAADIDQALADFARQQQETNSVAQ